MRPTKMSAALILALFVAACGGGSGLVLDEFAQAPTPPQKLVIDVEAVFLTGEFSLNGGSFPMHPYEAGRVVLASEGAGTVLLGTTPDGSFESCAVAGNYETAWEFEQGGEIVPRTFGRVLEAEPIVASQQLDVDVEAVTVTPIFLLDGGPFPGHVYASAQFFLRAQDEPGTATPLGHSHLDNPPLRVLPGTYDVVYEHTQGLEVPINKNTVVLSNVDIRANRTLTVNVPTVRDTTTFTLDGAPFPTSPYDHGVFEMVIPGTKARAPLGASYEAPAPRLLIPGTYDVIYSFVQGDDVPRNTRITIGQDLVMDGLVAHTIDVETAGVERDLLLNGGPFPASASERARFVLRTEGELGLVALGGIHDDLSDPLRVVKGTYDVIYEYVSGVDIPRNRFACVKSGCVIQNDLTLTIDVPMARLSARFVLNGNIFPQVSSQRGEFDLVGATRGDTFFLSRSDVVTSAPIWAIQGTYDVNYRHVVGENVPQNNVSQVFTGYVLSDPPQGLTVDVEARFVMPSLSQNGVPYSAMSPYNIASFLLRDTSGFVTPLAMSSDDGSPRMMIVGSYETVYRWIHGDDIAKNSQHTLGTVEIVTPE